jgi:hypothetical protein
VELPFTKEKPMRVLLVAIAIAVTTTASAKNFYIPVAGSIAGKGNTYFRTDVRIFNPSFTKDISVTVHFLPQGADNTNISGQLFAVPKRQMIVLNDICGSLYGWQPPLLGALRIDSNEQYDYNVLVDSRTYTDAPTAQPPGTFGQFIPALDANSALKKSVVMHVSSSGAYRTNAVIMNPQLIAAAVNVSLAFPDGALIAPPIALAVAPMSMIQFYVAEEFATTRTFDYAFQHFDSDRPIFSGASIVDNRSADAFFVPGLEDKDEVKPLPPPGDTRPASRAPWRVKHR